MHESQSRMWENMVGRGRPFATCWRRRIASCSAAAVDTSTPTRCLRAVNRVKPSFIRVEADEATYGLHIVLRFELEQELIEGRLAVADLPEAWNARIRELPRLEVPDDADGVLQDVHWSAGLIGYFPTYALGNLIAGQLWERSTRPARPRRADRRRRADGLREWLRENVHRHGSKFRRRAARAGRREPDRGRPFVDYLKAKLGR
jgi:carboxypeptidase Taq